MLMHLHFAVKICSATHFYAVVLSLSLSLLIFLYVFRKSCDALLRSSCLAGKESAFLNCTSLPNRNSSESCTVVTLKNTTGKTMLFCFDVLDSVCHCLDMIIYSFCSFEGDKSWIEDKSWIKSVQFRILYYYFGHVVLNI